jgi:hypothetical protein
MRRITWRSTLVFVRGLATHPALWMLSALLVAAPAAAAVNYGDFTGAQVDYLQVTEDASSAGDTEPLFGPPTVAGNSIDFDPVGFSATTSNGGIDFTDGNLKFTIMAHPFSAISTINFAEAGDTTLLGFGNDTTFSAVTTRLFIDILEVDFQPVDVVSLNNVAIPFAPSGGTFGLGTDGGGGPLFNSGWGGNVLVMVDQILIANNVPFTGGATKVSVNLDNSLSAISQPGTSAFIAKKNANGVVITVNIPIPEPNACLLAAFGLAGLFIRRRR